MADIATQLNMISTTFKRTSDKIANAVEDNVALYAWLKSKGKIKKLGGGIKVTEQVSLKENTNFAWQDPDTDTATAIVQVLDSAEYDWKYIYGNVVVTGAELRNNSAEWAFHNLLTALVENAKTTMTNRLNEAYFNITSTGEAKSLVGLPEQITVDGTGAVGGIDPATYPNWANQFEAITTTVDATTSEAFLAGMTTLFNNCTFGREKTDLIITTPAIRAKYEGSCQELKRFTGENKRAADLGYSSFDFNGAALIFDGGCPANTMYFLNTNYINFYVHKDANMKMTPKAKSEGNDKYLWMMLLQCAMTLSSRKHQGVLTFAAA